jgi:hypothetical protein
MELRKYKKTYSTEDLQATDSTVKVKFEVSQYQESRNWKKFKCMELATGTEIGNEKSYCKGKNDDWIIYPSNRQTQVQQ